jgi:hypothetical protein
LKTFEVFVGITHLRLIEARATMRMDDKYPFQSLGMAAEIEGTIGILTSMAGGDGVEVSRTGPRLPARGLLNHLSESRYWLQQCRSQPGDEAFQRAAAHRFCLLRIQP